MASLMLGIDIPLHMQPAAERKKIMAAAQDAAIISDPLEPANNLEVEGTEEQLCQDVSSSMVPSEKEVEASQAAAPIKLPKHGQGAHVKNMSVMWSQGGDNYLQHLRSNIFVRVAIRYKKSALSAHTFFVHGCSVHV